MLFPKLSHNFTSRCEMSHPDLSNTAPTNLTMSALLIPWKKSTSKEHAGTIKWSHILEDLELMFPLPHHLEAKEKIGLFFPRTVSTVLRTIWDMIIVDEAPAETVAAFDQCLHNYIGSHSTAEDCHDLVSQLRAPHEPREILVQSFCCHLREVNG
jgi:hypothetical protein